MTNAQRRIERMLARGVPFEHIEAYIESRSDLPADSQSALWLFAWVETSVDERRAIVRELIAELA